MDGERMYNSKESPSILEDLMSKRKDLEGDEKYKNDIRKEMNRIAKINHRNYEVFNRYVLEKSQEYFQQGYSILDSYFTVEGLPFTVLVSFAEKTILTITIQPKGKKQTFSSFKEMYESIRAYKRYSPSIEEQILLVRNFTKNYVENPEVFKYVAQAEYKKYIRKPIKSILQEE